MKIVFSLICILTTFCTYGQRGVVGYDAVVEGKQYTLVDVQTEYLNVCVPEHVFFNIIDNEELETTWCITAVFKKNTAWEMEWSEIEISLSPEEILDLKLTANLYYDLDDLLYGKESQKDASRNRR